MTKFRVELAFTATTNFFIRWSNIVLSLFIASHGLHVYFRCQNTVIGGTFFRGISGGERKRVCIANEILLNPSLLLLDEPTSGLDSTTALQIVNMLRNISQVLKHLLLLVAKIRNISQGVC